MLVFERAVSKVELLNRARQMAETKSLVYPLGSVPRWQDEAL